MSVTVGMDKDKETPKLYSPREVCERYKITSRTLLNWSYDGRIKFIRTTGGHRRYIIDDTELGELRDLTELGKLRELRVRRKMCYCRVSTIGQKEDLERQVEFFRLEYPNHEIITDIGSGLNFKRKGFNSILDFAIKGDVGEIVVTHRDRLCRFGFELVERIVTEHSHGRIVVLNKKETSPQEELSNDLISIITVFSSRLYGLRSHQIKNKIEEETKETKEINRGLKQERTGELQNNEV